MEIWSASSRFVVSVLGVEALELGLS